MFNITCPECGLEAQAPESMIGQQAECPSCKSYIIIRNPEAESKLQALPPALPPNSHTMSPDTRPCPFCAEKIKVTAIKCKFCHSMLSNPSSTYGGHIQNDEMVVQGIAKMEATEGTIWFVLAGIAGIIGMAGAVLYYGMRMNSLSYGVGVLGFFLIAGLYFLVGRDKFDKARLIRSRTKNVLVIYNVPRIVILFIVNFIILAGPLLAVIFLIFDCNILHKIQSNKHLFRDMAKG